MERECVFIRFSIVSDDWPVDEFTTKIGITPTTLYKVGDDYIRGNRLTKRFETVWSIESGEMPMRYGEDADRRFFESVIAPLKPHLKLINAYKEEHNLTCIFFVH